MLTQIDTYFKDQSLDNSNCFEKKGNYYQDKTFCFDSDEVEKNCFLSSDDKKNFELLKDLKENVWIQAWKSGWDNDNFSYEGINIDNKDLNLCNSYINNNYLELGLNSNNVQNLDELKEILKKKRDDYRFVSKIFDIVFSDKIYDVKYKNKNEEYLKEYRNLFEYKRISEMPNYNNYKIYENDIDCTYIEQGWLGTCYLLETISTLSNYGKLLYEIFPCKTLNENGIYEICIFHDGKWQKVLVDDYFILKNGTFAFTKPVNNCLYSCLIEKAYAKIKGSFADINGGTLVEAFKALTGFEAFHLSISELQLHSNIYDFLINKKKEGYIYSCSNKGHAFSLIDIVKEKNNDIILQIRNPWSSLSENENKLFNEFLSEYPKYKGIREQKENNKGIFFLNKKRFESYFKGGISICPILLNSNIYIYKLEDISSLLNCQNLFFKFKVSQHSKITVGINDINNFKVNSKALYTNNIDNNVKIVSNMKTDFLRNINKMKYYEIYTEIAPSTQILNIDLTKISFDIIKNKIITITIQGKVENLYFLGCHPKEPIFGAEILELSYLHYKYGSKTLKALTKENNAINALKDDFDISNHPDSVGFHKQSVFTNDVELNLNYGDENELLNLLVCSPIYLNLNISNISAKSALSEDKTHVQKDEPKKEEPYKDPLILPFLDNNNNNNNNNNNLDLVNKSCPDILSSKIYPKILTNENFGFSITHAFHEHKLSYSNKIKKFKCKFCLKIFNNYKPSFHCQICHYHLCIECSKSIDEYDSFYKNMKKTKKTIKEFNSKNIIVDCGFHIHDLKKENVYNNHGFLCDLCFKVINLSKAYHCNKCKFDLCENCLLNAEANENTRNQLILNEEISEVFLVFDQFNPTTLGKIILDKIFLGFLILFISIYRFCKFEHPFFIIKTKRNYEILLEYGRFNKEQKYFFFDNKRFRTFFPNFINNEVNQPIYFNNGLGDGIRIIEMNIDNYIDHQQKFYLKFDSNKFERLYDLLNLISKTHPEKGDYYDRYSFTTQFIRLANCKIDYTKIFDKDSLYSFPKEILNQLKKNEEINLNN